MEINRTEPKYNRQRNKIKWLVFIEYPNGKHHLFITYETERQLLKRIKKISFDATNKIAYLDAYEIYDFKEHGETTIRPYGEYNYRFKEMPNDNGEISIKMPLKYWNRIAAACISVADYGIINDKIKSDLRKTYYQIKAETR